MRLRDLKVGPEQRGRDRLSKAGMLRIFYDPDYGGVGFWNRAPVANRMATTATFCDPAESC
jgi:hypothetical protein